MKPIFKLLETIMETRPRKKISIFFTRILYLPVVVYLACLTNSQSLYAQISPKDQPIFDKILADWQSRFKTVKSIEYVIVAVDDSTSKKKSNEWNIFPKSGIFAKLNQYDYFPKQKRYEIIFEISSGKILIKCVTSNPILNYTEMWDGKYITHISPPELNQGKLTCDRSIRLGDSPNSISPLDLDIFPVFAAHGIFALGDEVALRINNLKMRDEFDDVRISGKATHNGKECLIINTSMHESLPSSYEECWVDPLNQSAINRFLLYSGEKPSIDIQINYQNVNDISIPESWTFLTYFEKSVLKRKYKVESFRINGEISSDVFFPPLKPKEKISYSVRPPLDSDYMISSAYFYYEIDENLKPNLFGKRGFRNQFKVEVFPEENFDWIPKKVTPKGSKRDWILMISFVFTILLLISILVWTSRRQNNFKRKKLINILN